MENLNTSIVIEIFKKLEQGVPRELLSYLIRPNMILTLSAERSLGDGVFWFDKESELRIAITDLKKIKKAILEHIPDAGFYYSKFTNPGLSDQLGLEFTFLYRKGLKKSLSSTSLLSQESKNFIISKTNSGTEDDEFKLILSEVSNNPKLAEYDEEGLGAIVQGIELGYPDKAILSYVDNQYNHNDRERSFYVENGRECPYEEAIDAEIKFSGYIPCPEPRYSYARSMINDQDIMRHESRWSKILSDFYWSDFFTKLSEEPEFRKKLDLQG